MKRARRTRRWAGLCVAAGLALAPAAHAQTPTVLSPEVTHTGTGPTGYSVTFRYYDGNPATKNVKIRGEWYLSGVADTTTTTSAGRLPSQYQRGDFPIAYPNQGPAANWPVIPMTQDPTTLVWSYTTPMPSGTWTYGFLKNCTDATYNSVAGCPTSGQISDPGNPPWNTRGSIEPDSELYVPSDPAFGTEDLSYLAPNPVHGQLEDVNYPDPTSTSPVGSHDLGVYLPPGYDPNRATPYPTLYLSHGTGGQEVNWSTQGAAGNIIDNLIARGQVQPMVIVMTDFNNLGSCDRNDASCYANSVVNSVLPYVEAHYNVSHNANDRAFGGMSAGGRRTGYIMFNYTTKFGYYGIWSSSQGVPANDDPQWQNPQLKSLLGLQIGGGYQDQNTFPGDTALMAQLDANHIPYTTDFMNGGHEWYVWRKNLYDYVRTIAFRQTSVALSTSGTTVTATITPGTKEPTAPTGTVQFSAGGTPLGGPVALSDGKATLTVPSTAGASSITASYSGDALYNASTASAAYAASSVDGTVGGTVGATLSLVLGSPASFAAFRPGIAADYTAGTTATVTSTAGDATLSVADPSTVATGHLTNGTFSLPSPLLAAGSPLPAVVKTYTGPVTNDNAAIPFSQHIGANDALRTGAYTKTLTFTLSTTTP